MTKIKNKNKSRNPKAMPKPENLRVLSPFLVPTREMNPIMIANILARKEEMINKDTARNCQSISRKMNIPGLPYKFEISMSGITTNKAIIGNTRLAIANLFLIVLQTPFFSELVMLASLANKGTIILVNY